MNPRFIAYATAHGRTPEAQLEHDRETYPGGSMAGFILWIADRRRAFKARCPEAFVGDLIRDQEAWTAFLQQP